MPNIFLVLVSLFAGLALFVGLAIRKHVKEVNRTRSNESAIKQQEKELQGSASLAEQNS